MSNISRRDFLKTAGVMTLAVAAAGVLAGCEGKTNVPNTETTETPSASEGTVTYENGDKLTLAATTYDVYTDNTAVDAENSYTVLKVTYESASYNNTAFAEGVFIMDANNEVVEDFVSQDDIDKGTKVKRILDFAGIKKGDVVTDLGDVMVNTSGKTVKYMIIDNGDISSKINRDLTVKVAKFEDAPIVTMKIKNIPVKSVK